MRDFSVFPLERWEKPLFPEEIEHYKLIRTHKKESGEAVIGKSQVGGVGKNEDQLGVDAPAFADSGRKPA